MSRKNIRTCRASLLMLLGCMLIPWPALGAPSNAQQAGLQLARKVYNRPDGKDSSFRVTMTLVQPGNEPRVRRMFVYRRDLSGGGKESLIRFVAPSDISGTGVLTIDHSGGETDQWIYLPALHRARRIASNRKGGRFVGSDLFYEDLRDRKVSKDHHKLLGTQKLHGVECKVVESVPVNPDNSVYSKRVSWIYPKTLIPLRVDFYESGRNKPIKRLTVHKIEKIQGYWTIMDSTMTDLRSGHYTRLTVQAAVYNRNLPAELFSREVLTDPVRGIPYRP